MEARRQLNGIFKMPKEKKTIVNLEFYTQRIYSLKECKIKTIAYNTKGGEFIAS